METDYTQTEATHTMLVGVGTDGAYSILNDSGVVEASSKSCQTTIMGESDIW